jgi:hypothetical protein
VMADGLFGSNQTVVGVNLLAYLGFLGPVSTYPANVGIYVVIMGLAITTGYLLGRAPPRGRVRISRSDPSGTVESAGGMSPPTASPIPPGATSSSSDWVVGPPPAPTTPTDPGAPPPTS